MIGKGDYRAVHIDLLGSVAGALSLNGIAPATLQSVRDALAENDTVTAMQEQIAALQAELSRAREALLLEWATQRFDCDDIEYTSMRKSAEARYACEIAQEPTS